MSDAVPIPSPSDFGTLEELECRGRLVFLRTDPSLVTEVAATEMPIPTTQTAEGPVAAVPTGGEASTAARNILGPGACATTLKRLLELEARVIVATHLTGREFADEGLTSMEELGMRLSEQLRVEVLMPDECLGDAVKMVTGDLRDGQVCLLPDLLSHPGEASGDEGFARALASYCDSYVGDAIAASHLQYASLTRLPRLCARRALGLNARAELSAIQTWLSGSAAPRLLIVGGRLFSQKIELLDELLTRVHTLHLTGGVANTVLAATGRNLGETPIEQKYLARARSFLTRARDLGVKVSLPVDVRVRKAGRIEQFDVAEVPQEAVVIDLGPASIAALESNIVRARGMLAWGPGGCLSTAEGTTSTLALLKLANRAGGPRLLLGEALRQFTLKQSPETFAGAGWVITGSVAAKCGLAQGSLPGIEALRASP